MTLLGFSSKRKVAAKSADGKSAQADARNLLEKIEMKQVHADNCMFC